MSTAPWCGHCKKLAPIYAEAATTLAPENIPLCSVDCIAEEALYWSNGIKGYPTLLAFLAGEPVPYEGEREAHSMVSFMRHLQAPVLVPLDGVEAATSFCMLLPPSQPAVLVLVPSERTAASELAERTLDLVCKQLGEAVACGVVVVRQEQEQEEERRVTVPGFAVLPASSEARGRGGVEGAVAMDFSDSTGEACSGACSGAYWHTGILPLCTAVGSAVASAGVRSHTC